MTSEQVLLSITDRCDIYFEGSLISKELIVKKYADFLTTYSFRENHSIRVALHTGSICFEIVALITAALGCLKTDEFGCDDILQQLEIGNFVLYGVKRQERYMWGGYADKYYQPIVQNTDIIDSRHFAVLVQPTKAGQITYVPRARWNLITPYNGESHNTDGRGIKRRDSDRNDFISYMFNISSEEIPSITGVSTVIVTDRDLFERISRGLRIVYGENLSIGLLDLVTASYYSDSGEEYPYGGNIGRNEPVLKIAGKVSTARDLVLNKRGNRTIGLLVIGSENMEKGGSELDDLLSRKSLTYAHLTANIDSDIAENVIEKHEDAAVFACTKEFLLNNSLPPSEENLLTAELDRQVDNIVNNCVSTEIVYGGCSWDDLRKVHEALNIIRKSTWDDEPKDRFICVAHSLLNLFLTAVFPIEVLEKATDSNKLIAEISSPSTKILELWDYADKAAAMHEHCTIVGDILERLYKLFFSTCPKYASLKLHLASSDKKIAVVVPKAYYIDILKADESLNAQNITFVTGNRFDDSEQYDEIVSVGDFRGKRFNPLKCRAASDIIVLLYEGETNWFRYKKHKAETFLRMLNSKLGLSESGLMAFDESIGVDSTDNDVLDRFAVDSTDLEQYIERINTFDIRKYAARASGIAGNTPTSEVGATGRFVSGEQILFSKFYNAVVFNVERGTVVETDIEHLTTGDILVFAKRDDYTRNMVDYIYESLQISKRLSPEVIDATEKASYWKEVIREYKEIYDLSYRDIAKELQQLGSSIQEIRQWFIEESHVVGPRDEITMRHIAELTKDKYLLGDTHGYFEACRIVRHQRKEILGLIGKAIVNKLSGFIPAKGSIFEVVHNNVENLSETLELESISLLNEPLNVPINIINKPINEREVVA